MIKQDTAGRYDILVIGEEPHIAYNRVGLSTYFEHRKIEDLYLNPKEWVSYCYGQKPLKDYIILRHSYSTDHSKSELLITTSTPESPRSTPTTRPFKHRLDKQFPMTFSFSPPAPMPSSQQIPLVMMQRASSYTAQFKILKTSLTLPLNTRARRLSRLEEASLDWKRPRP